LLQKQISLNASVDPNIFKPNRDDFKPNRPTKH